MANTLPQDANSVLYEGERDTAGQQFVAKQTIGTITTDAGGVKSAAQAVGVADGGDVAQGATTDAAVTGDNSGTLSAKLRGLTKILADVWDSVNHRLKVDGSGVTQPVSGTLTANVGTTNGLALDATVAATQVAQGSTTSGEKGTLIQGAVTTSAPSYTTAQSNPLSLTTAGALRTDGSATTQPVSGTVTANAGTNMSTAALALEGGGNLATIATRTPALGQAAMASSSPVVIASDQSTLTVSQKAAASVSGTLQSAAVATGVGSSLSVLGMASSMLTVTGTFVGTITFQGSEDGSTWASLTTSQVGTNTLGATTTGTGMFEASVAGLQSIRANITAYVSGSITVTAHAVPVTWATRVVNANQVNGPYTQNLTQVGGSSVALGQAAGASSLPVVIASDQSNVPANIKQINGSALALGSATGANSLPVVVASDQGNLPANIAQMAGTTTDTNSGNKSAGTLRVVVATDQPALTNALKVDGSAVTQPVSGTITANAGTNLNTSLLALDTSVNGVLINQGSTTAGQKGLALAQGAVTTSAPTYVTGKSDPLSLNTAGGLRVDGSGVTQPVQATPATTGGTTVARFDSASGTNATSTKASAGQLYGGHVGNNGAGDAWVKFYNKASAPTVGTDTPFLIVYVPKGSAQPIPISLNGIPLGTGIAYAITGGAADTDTTSVASHQVTGWFEYK